jgi:hypothetical protein
VDWEEREKTKRGIPGRNMKVGGIGELIYTYVCYTTRLTAFSIAQRFVHFLRLENVASPSPTCSLRQNDAFSSIGRRLNGCF